MQPTTSSLAPKDVHPNAPFKPVEQQLQEMSPRQLCIEYIKISRRDPSEMTLAIWDNKLSPQGMCEHQRRLGFLQTLWLSDPNAYRKRREEYYSKQFKAFRQSCRAHMKWMEEQTANRAEQVAKEQPSQVGHQSQQDTEDVAGSSKDPDWVMVDDADDDFVMVASVAKCPQTGYGIVKDYVAALGDTRTPFGNLLACFEGLDHGLIICFRQLIS
ncbi:MAG: hypothetical protein Q9174_000590 [Haloplaca sp. 1 TL-2023]